MPVLFYGLNVISPNKTSLSAFEKVINRSIGKIFYTYDSTALNLIRHNCGIEDVKISISYMQSTFMSRFNKKYSEFMFV